MIHPLGPGETREVNTGSVSVMQAEWLSDMRRLLIIGREPGKAARAYITEIDSGATRAITPEGIASDPNDIALSHDGLRVALRSPDGAITLYSTNGQPPLAAKGFEGAEMPSAWSQRQSVDVRVDRRDAAPTRRHRPGDRQADAAADAPASDAKSARSVSSDPHTRRPHVRRELPGTVMKLFVVEGLR